MVGNPEKSEPFCQILYSLRKDLEDYELKWVDRIYGILEGKKNLSQNVIDITKLCTFTDLTETQCRRIINYIEWNKYHFTTFIIENGSEEWKRQDEIRFAQVQKAAGSSDPERGSNNN